jgi:hypothetical protein
MQAGEAIAREVVEAEQAINRERRTFGPADLDALFGLLDSGTEVVTLADALKRDPATRAGLIALRHDIDHDLENAVRLAHIEAERGYRASYYMLHSDWYYRAELGVGPPAQSLLDACHEIASLGHEIALHNNAITQGLLTGVSPSEIVRTELDYLRGAGLEVTGSVAHGDGLCHVCGYVNYEIFEECERPKSGVRDRMIVFDDWKTGVRRQLKLDPVPMSSFGLEYEANFLRHNLYLSDSGGHWHVPFEDVREKFVERNAFLQILMHPVWWALDGV